MSRSSNAEPRVNYNRIMLSPVLSGEKTYEDIIVHDDAWYAHHGVTLHRGRKIAAIDRNGKIVHAEDGTSAKYDRAGHRHRFHPRSSSPFPVMIWRAC